MPTSIVTEQHNKVSQARKMWGAYVAIRVRKLKRDERFGESQNVVEHLSGARCVLKTNDEIEICPAKRNIRQEASNDF